MSSRTAVADGAFGFLEEHAGHMRRYFVGRAHPDVQDDLRRSMEEVGQRLLELGEPRFEEVLRRIRYLRGELHPTAPQRGVRELWKWLALFHLLDPQWQFSMSEYENFEMQNDFLRLLYSLNTDPMRDIVFDFAERLAKGEHRSHFARHGFPRRIILGNAYLEDDAKYDDDENLCEHCRPAGRPPSFHQVIQDIGHTDSRGILQGIDPNRVGEVRITCHDCLHKVREEPNLGAILKRLGEVI